MTGGRGLAAAGQDEFLERGQLRVETVQFFFQPVDMRRPDHDMAGNAQFTAEIEQVVLYRSQAAPDFRRQSGHAYDHSQRTIGFINGAVGLDPQALLGDTSSVPEAGAAIIARARINFAKPIAHDSTTPPKVRR